MSSASAVKRATPKAYNIGTHPVKKKINEWLIQLAVDNLPRPTALNRWALILEASDAQTIFHILSAIEFLGIPEDRICVPNPDETQLSCIRKRFPNVRLYPLTSHEFLESLALGHSNGAVGEEMLNRDDRSTEMLSDLRSSKFCAFDFVWLDYCGTFSSRAGRKRQEDIRTLFQNHFLSIPSILITTLTERGAAVYYENEIVDQSLAFITHAAKTVPGVIVSCKGVATYSISGKVFTMAVKVDEAKAAATCADLERIPPQKKEVFRPGESLSSKVEVEFKGSRKRLANSMSDCNLYNGWSLFSGINSGTVFWHAILDMSSKFASICSGKGVALVLDNKLLAATKAIVSASEKSSQTPGGDLSGVFVFFSDPQTDRPVAEYVGRTSVAEQTPLTLMRPTWQNYVMGRLNPSCLESLDYSNVRSVWLGYEGVCRTARSLQNCRTWQDLHYILASGVFQSEAGGVLGMHLKYIITGQCWKYSAIDWTIGGVMCAASQYELALTCKYVCTFATNAPHVCIIFTCGKHSTQSISVEHNTIPQRRPKHWREWFGWNRSREKEPTGSVAKYRRSSGAILRLLKNLNAKCVLLHEPGWFEVLPTLGNQGIEIVMCANGDMEQHSELNRRHGDSDFLSNKCYLLPTDIPNLDDIDALVLLSDGGWRRWLNDWEATLKCWVNTFPPGQNQKALIALASKGDNKISSDFLETVLRGREGGGRCSIASLHISMLTPLRLIAESLCFDLSCWLFTEEGPTVEKCESQWNLKV